MPSSPIFACDAIEQIILPLIEEIPEQVVDIAPHEPVLAGSALSVAAGPGPAHDLAVAKGMQFAGRPIICCA